MHDEIEGIQMNLTSCCANLTSILHGEDYIRGVIFAVAAAPEIPMPQQWFTWVFKRHGQLTDSNQADQLADVLMDELKQQLAQMRALPEQGEIGFDYGFPNHLGPENPVSQWFAGLLFAHRALESVWQDAWQQMQAKMDCDLQTHQKDLRHCLSMFSTFANMPLAIEQAQIKGNAELKQQLPQIFLSLPMALGKYVYLSGRLVSYLPDQFEQFKQR